jgi:peptidyl-tRNA hydrolase, PTH1 family
MPLKAKRKKREKKNRKVPMKLIAGLGNPGQRYKHTRHNVGFRVVEALAEKHNGHFKKRLFFNARECMLEISGSRVIVIQPLSFMNLSGRVVLKYANRFKIKPDNILIIYDDIDLLLGTFKIRLKGSSGGHNGIGSVIQSFGTDNISRIKVGINAGYKPDGLSEYVLSNFEKDEPTQAEKAIGQAVLECERWIAEKI